MCIHDCIIYIYTCFCCVTYILLLYFSCLPRYVYPGMTDCVRVYLSVHVYTYPNVSYMSAFVHGCVSCYVPAVCPSVCNNLVMCVCMCTCVIGVCLHVCFNMYVKDPVVYVFMSKLVCEGRGYILATCKVL